MKLLILYYSRTGNNRLLATHLAEKIGADMEEIHAVRKVTVFRLMMDFFRNRKPKIQPITKNPADYDHVLFLAPLYDMGIAHPMKTALTTLKQQLGDYSFVTFCGYQRDKQTAHVRAEMESLTGHEPAHILELHVGDLVPKENRGKVSVVSSYQVKAGELDAFDESISTITGWFA